MKIEEGMRVRIVSGFYEGHRGEVIKMIGDRWRVRLDQADKLALVDEGDMVPE